jgi:ATP-dependent Zn protease
MVYNVYTILFYVCLLNSSINSLQINHISNRLFTQNLNKNPFGIKYYEQYLKYKNNNSDNVINNTQLLLNKNLKKKYYLTSPETMEKIKNLNSKNTTIQNNSILGNDTEDVTNDPNITIYNKPQLRIILNKSNFLQSLGIGFNEVENNEEREEREGNFEDDEETGRRNYVERKKNKSKNFEIIENSNVFFSDVGGYENVKNELRQCVDILKNYQKYAQYNVRIPKGLILEGPPGTGKTLLAKALAGESKCSFITVSGSDFQEKYVGVGPTRVRELFGLAKKNIPCIIFIDEIDALGRKRSSDGESASNERDNTLNALLVELDGFKNNTGIFVVAATNRIDLLDNALIRPGRIDKKIYIGLPDSSTREAIINIHIKGKPFCDSIGLSELVEVTEGLSGAQIENLLNEAMLNALRLNNTQFCYKDFDFVMNKLMAGCQPIDHEFTSDIIDHIAIHEMGHSIVGFLSKYHS